MALFHVIYFYGRESNCTVTNSATVIIVHFMLW